MKVHSLLLLFIPLLLLTACYGSQRQQMLSLLDQADSLNRAYAPLPSDSLLQEAARFFDRHGTPDEQVRAYYLLGSAYRDQGQAPEALQAWHDALDCADTLSTDSSLCALLSRVYSQMAFIFYNQNLMADNLECLDRSIVFAQRAKDSVAAFNSNLFRMSAFIRQGVSDSVISICNQCYEKLVAIGQQRKAARNAIAALPSFIAANQYERAAYYLKAYEQNSGYFNPSGQIEQGREVYYYFKGLYYLSVHQYDLAEHYFRKELHYGKDFNNQNAGARGLALLYEETNRLDSAAKYAMYSYAMNDSAYSRMATGEVERMQSMYNYSTHQRNALLEKERANRKKLMLNYVVFCFVVILLLVSMSVYRWNEKRKTEQKAYLETLDRLGNVQKELQLLRSHEEGLGELIAEKEKEVGNLLQEINSLRKWQDPINTDKELLLKSSPVCQELERVSSVGRYLTEEEWSRIDNFVKETLPDFYQLISSKRYALNVKEFRTCILLRLYVKPGGISHILGVDPSYITKISKHISEVLFNTQWTSKQLTVQLCRFF